MALSSISSSQTFRSLDTSRDSKVSLKEFQQGLALAPASLRNAVKESNAKTVFTSFDTDKNGSLSTSELSKGIDSVTIDTAALLLQAQEQASPSANLATSLQVGLYNTMPGMKDSYGLTAANVLAAYFNK